MRAKLFMASSALAAMLWAAPSAGAAHFIANRVAGNANTTNIPAPLPARFRLEKERGLLLRVWINGGGPYIFAVDTGAGSNVIAQRVVTEARLPTKGVRSVYIGGLTGAQTLANREATISQIALGTRGNTLPSKQTALVVSNLPPDIDGVLDPTEAYSPFGYSIDMVNERIDALPADGINAQTTMRGEGATVPWLRLGADDRPFVQLGDGRTALVDTGSSFGLAVSDQNAVIIGRNGARANTMGARDLGGGSIVSRRVAPTTISIGGLVLRRIPTDILFGVEKGAPTILGRDALYPFKISFDPQTRLIQFVTSSED